MSIVLFGVLSLYAITIIVILNGYSKIPEQHTQFNKKPRIAFSVIIPFRNEAENLPELFKSIEGLKYPESLVEFLLVNDASSDASVSLAESFIASSKFKLQLLNRELKSNAPKKDAITTAINHAAHNWIITTDADCKLTKNWLLAYNEFISNNEVDLVASSVKLEGKKTLLHQFQVLEHLSLQTTTVGAFGLESPIMCNGANLAYTKQLFKELNGFEGNDHLASGDDLFLLEKATRLDKSLDYLKSQDAIVQTKTQTSFKALLNQRIRWASKTTVYKSKFALWTAWIMLLCNLLIVFCFLLLIVSKLKLDWFLLILLTKFLFDLLLALKSASFHNQRSALLWFLPSALIYPFWTIIISLGSLKKGYVWKERKLQ